MDLELNKAESKPKFLASTGTIRPYDFYNWFRSTWIYIVAGIFIGSIVSAIYLLMVPNQYVVVTQIQMGRQISGIGLIDQSAEVNIESPKLLVLKFSSIHDLPSEVIDYCNPNVNNLMIKVSPVKDLDGVIELRVSSSLSGVAKLCASKIFTYIEEVQLSKIDPKINYVKSLIDKNHDRIIAVKQLFSSENVSKEDTLKKYFAVEDIRFLNTQNAQLNNFLAISEMLRHPKLLTSTTISEKKISPNFKLVILAGLIAGILIGILVSQIVLLVKGLKLSSQE